MSKKILALFLAILMLFTMAAPQVLAANFGTKSVNYKGHTYVLVNESMTWKQAKAYCEKQGGYLATITSQGEQDVITNLIKGASKNFYWLGATDEKTEGAWTWITGEPFTYFGPSNDTTLDDAYSGEDYLQIYSNYKGDKSQCGVWNDANNESVVSKSKDFYDTKYTGLICEIGTSEMPLNENSMTFNGHTYTALDMPLSWFEAKAFCEAQGGNLATITSAAEQLAVEEAIRTGHRDQYWLGGTDSKEENMWEWVTGEPFTFWSKTVTFDDYKNGEDYLQIQTNNYGDTSKFGYWNDMNSQNYLEDKTNFYSKAHVGVLLEMGKNEMPIEDSSTTPIIYIKGRTNIYDTEGKLIFNGDTNAITKPITSNFDLMAEAVVTGTWNRYCNKVMSDVDAKFGEYRLNNEGEVENGSHIKWSWDPTKISHVQTDMFSYIYEYDARLDPCDIADDLHDYIEAIKKTTKKDTVHIVARCLGANIATAYFAEYGWDDVETAVFYSSAALGYDYISDIFTQDLYYRTDSLDQYCNQRLDEDDIEAVEVLNFVKSLVSFLNKSGLMVYGTSSANSLMKSISDKIGAKMIRAAFATCPGYWSMVNDSHYEKAKQVLFGDEVNTTYKTLVKKIDNYHYNVMNKTIDMLKQMDKDGVKINIICKYGLQTPPVVKSSRELSDNTIDVYSQSFYGATCAYTGHTLTKEYIANAKKSGTDKYISPDKMIDSSTALFPDRTWYIKNYEHAPFYDCFNQMLMDMCYSEKQMTVDSDERYPQYLIYDLDTKDFSPLTDGTENQDPDKIPSFNDFQPEKTSSNPILRFFLKLGEFLRLVFGIKKK